MSVFYDIFEDAFQEAGDTVVDESVLDFPKGKGLSRDVWKQFGGEYVLTDEAKTKIQRIVDWAVSKFGFKNPKVHIVGSICSNTFSDESDIDLHFCADNITKGNADDINSSLAAAFKRKFGGRSRGEVEKHPIEVYAQQNPNQDLMSVGCYDFNDSKWLVGPEILDDEFNPYEEYYDGINRHLDKVGEEVREHVLKCGEIATLIQKISGNVGKDDKFLTRMEKELADAAAKARKLFDEVRAKRSESSDPDSPSSAKRIRDSKGWKIADSSFKYLDKLGYIATLLTIAKVGEDEAIGAKRKAEKIIEGIHERLFNKDKDGYADIKREG